MKKKTTPKTTAEQEPGRIENLKISLLQPNKWNPQRPVSDDFILSIKTNGILQPLVVRAVGKKFEIIAGERRWRAAKDAGIETIQCKIIDVDDTRAHELSLVENIERANLSPIEEAVEIAELVKKHNGDFSEVAARIGRSRYFVKSRLALATLDVSSLKTIGIDPLQIPVACLELLAKTPPETRQKILDDHDVEWILSDYEYLRSSIVRISKKLEKEFDAEDETLLPEVGACSQCPKRSGADKDLFGNVQELNKMDFCLDSDCYKQKIRADLARKEAAARKKYPKLILAAIDIPYAEKQEAERRNVSEIDGFRRSRWTIAKKSDEGAVPAFLWCGKDAGSVVFVKPKDEKDMHANARTKTHEEKRERLKQRRLAWVSKRVNEMIKSEQLHESFHSWEWLCRILLRFTFPYMDSVPEEIADVAPLVAEKTIIGRLLDETSTATKIGEALMLILGEENSFKKFEELRSQAVEEIPEPKSWAKEKK